MSAAGRRAAAGLGGRESGATSAGVPEEMGVGGLGGRLRVFEEVAGDGAGGGEVDDRLGALRLGVEPAREPAGVELGIVEHPHHGFGAQGERPGGVEA